MKQLTVAILFAILLTGCGQLSDDGTFLTIRSADPRLNFHVRLLQPTAVPTGTLDVLPEATAQPTATPEATAEPTATPECLIKVNRASDGTFVYHLPGGVYYDRTKVEPEKQEFYACSEADAQKAGARKSSR